MKKKIKNKVPKEQKNKNLKYLKKKQKLIFVERLSAYWLVGKSRSILKKRAIRKPVARLLFYC